MPKNKTKKAAKNPYWSLRGKLKFRDQYIKDLQEKEDNDPNLEIGGGIAFKLAEEYYFQEYKKLKKNPLLLPKRGTTVESDSEELKWQDKKGNWHFKKIKNDFHAVLSLKKLDEDDDYFNCKENSLEKL